MIGNVVMSSEYIPGVCNIGPAEIRRRKFIGRLAAGLALVLWTAVVALRAAPEWRLLVFFPATLSALCYLQAAAHFCVKYGLAGVFNVGLSVGKTDRVEPAEAHRQDRRTALRIIGFAVLIGAFIAAAAYLAPV